jgi:hypothetical protein
MLPRCSGSPVSRKTYGKTEMISANNYQNAFVDPIAVRAFEIIHKMNSKPSDLALFCKTVKEGTLLDATSLMFAATKIEKHSLFIFWIDRLGFNLLGKIPKDETLDFTNAPNPERSQDQWLDLRFPFASPMETVQDCVLSLEGSIQNLQNQK